MKLIERRVLCKSTYREGKEVWKTDLTNNFKVVSTRKRIFSLK